MQDLIYIMQDFFRQMKKSNISIYSAGAAFFLLLSVGPMLAFLCAWIPYLSLTKEEFVALISQILPGNFQGMMSRMVTELYSSSPKVMSIAALLMLWAAGKGTLALMRGLNLIHGVEEHRNYFAVRLIASYYTLVIIFAVFLLLGLVFFSRFLLSSLFRYLLVWIVFTVLFTGVYTFLPDRRLKILEQLPGAILASTVWLFYSWGFSIYMNTADLTVIYGSLSLVALMMLWLYFGIYIILAGAYFNCYYRRHHTRCA